MVNLLGARTRVLPALSDCFACAVRTGLVNVTAGATVSMVHDAWAGLESVLPEGLIARTSKACGPSTRAL
jgi:hypothetical protein